MGRSAFFGDHPEKSLGEGIARKYQISLARILGTFKPSVNLSIFMSWMIPLRGKHGFIFATHGGHAGNFMPAAARILGRQGLVVMGTFDCDSEVWFGK